MGSEFKMSGEKESSMITSSANAQMKYLVKLQEKGAARKEDGVYVCEGKKMFAEVLSYAAKSVVKAYFAESFYEKWRGEFAGEVPFEIVSDAVFKEVSRTVTPQGVLAIVRQPDYSLEGILAKAGRDAPCRLLILENLRDPGNLGTILRTAEGAGMAGIILGRGSVDMFNPKVIRSTMGAIYRLPFVYKEDFPGLLGVLKQWGFMVYAAHLAGSVEYDTVEYNPRTALMLGNEANGLTEEAAAAADLCVRIPMEGELESLNAAVAAAVLMYETYRQARAGRDFGI